MDVVDTIDRIRFRTVRVALWTRGAFGPEDSYASDVRGALGKALRGTPAYVRLFEPPLPEGPVPTYLRGGDGAPRPYVPRAPFPARLPREGGRVLLELISFLTDIDDADVYARALVRAAGDGFGMPRARFACDGVEIGPATRAGDHARDRWALLTRGGQRRLRVRIVTPARMLREGREVAHPDLGDLAFHLARRALSIAWLYGDRPGEEGDPRVALALAREAQGSEGAHREIRTQRGRRYSHSQDRVIPLSGVAGTIEARTPPPLALLLLAGEVLNVGKSTTTGMGRLVVETAEGDDVRPEPAASVMGGAAPVPRGRRRLARGGAGS